MLYTQNLQAQTVETNAAVNLGQASIQTCNSGVHFINGQTQFSIGCPGYYSIEYTVNGTSTGAVLSFELQSNGVTIPGQDIQFTAPDGQFTATGFGAVHVRPSCPSICNKQNITLVNTSAAQVSLTGVNVLEVKYN